MEKIKQKGKQIKEIFKDKRLYIFLLITLVSFGIFIIKNYTVDTYGYEFDTNPGKQLATLGRIITATFVFIFSKINIESMYIVSFILAIIATTFSMYKLNEILKRDIKNEIITIIISISVIINFNTLELFMFIEKGIMMFSVLLTVLAIGHIEDALKGDKRAWMVILIEMFLANCCYQGTVGLFIAIGVIYIIKNSKNIIDFIKNNMIVGLLYAVPAFINLIIVKFIFNSSRLENSVTLKEKIFQVVQTTKNILTQTFDILPKYLYLTILIIIIGLFIINLIKNREKASKIVLNILKLIYIISAVLVSAMAPQIISADVYVVPRNVYCIGALIAIVLIFMYREVEVNKISNIIVILLQSVLIVSIYYNFSCIILDNYYTNKKDFEIAEKITKIIEDYETKTNNKITKMATYINTDKIQYEDTRYIGDANVRAFCTEWSSLGIMEKFLNRPLSYADKDSEIAEKFENEDWKDYEFDENQVLLQGDTLHLCTK